jgi:hypothetical protein
MRLNSERKINKREAIPAASYIYSGRVNLSWVLGKNTSKLKQGNCREMIPSLKKHHQPMPANTDGTTTCLSLLFSG